MTIRDLIEQGAGLDDEIDVEANVYDADGRPCGIFINCGGISFDSFSIVPGRITIKVDIEPV